MPKILVVDDVEHVRTFVSFCLNLEGYEVTVANNGALGFEVFQKENFDLVITDLRMPELWGDALIEKIQEFNSKQRIILMSGGLSLDEELYLREKFGVAILDKPFYKEDLLRAVKFYLL